MKCTCKDIQEKIPDYRCKNCVRVMLESANIMFITLPAAAPGLVFTFQKTGDFDIVVR